VKGDSTEARAAAPLFEDTERRFAMNRLHLIALTTVGALAFSPASAVEEHHPDQAAQQPAATAAAPGSDQNLARMRENVRKMQRQMDQIRKTKDPAQRQRLLQEHMQTLQENMTMGMGMGPGMMGGMGQGMMAGGGMMGGMGMGGMGMGGMGMGGMGMGGMGGGMGAGMGQMDGMGRIMSLPGLTDQQRSQIQKIQDELVKKHLATRSKIVEEQFRLRDLSAADKPDAAAIGAAYKNIFDLQRQMIEATIDSRNRMYELLTPEQREALKLRQRMGGMGLGGMGMDMMGCPMMGM
jgi:Spy/CpxP family protein refolding chaperone